MREFRTSGSVGAPGERSPGATRRSGGRGGRRRYSYDTALMEARETLTNLETAESIGYICGIDATLRGRLNHIIGTLVRILY